MISEQLLREMVRRIHACPELNGCRIGLYGNYQCRVLHHGYNVGLNSERVIIIIEEVETDDATVLRDLRQWATAAGGSPAGSPNPLVVTNRSRLGPELIGAGLSCGLTVVSFLGVAGGIAGDPYWRCFDLPCRGVVDRVGHTGHSMCQWPPAYRCDCKQSG